MASRKSKAPKKADPLDFILWENSGDDPRPMVELPDGVEPGQCQTPDVDSIGTVYAVGDDDGEHVAVLVLVVTGGNPRTAAARMISGCANVARDLFGGIARGDDEEG